MSNDTEYAVEHEQTLVQRYLTIFHAIDNLEFDDETDTLATDALWAAVALDKRLTRDDHYTLWCALHA